ncbi:hypothetical protein QR680_010919 [Steinernema hermaphroditum]|uniref:Uncharacterized protein n=1 Tax=Steinernema hermaphroditum TaxID=289476 RepID=A0AA39IQJ1_9BILA|nr:hypothetical protein QR680_010919 [Steinernema hermaphroditum]
MVSERERAVAEERSSILVISAVVCVIWLGSIGFAFVRAFLLVRKTNRLVVHASKHRHRSSFAWIDEKLFADK